MRTWRTQLLAVFMVLLAACTTDDATLATLQEEMEEAGGDIAAAIAAAQEDMSDIGQRIQESEASEDLRNAWVDVQAELTEFFTSLLAEGTVDTEQIEQVMDDFESQLDQAGDQIAPEVREAWESLRTQIELLIEQAS